MTPSVVVTVASTQITGNTAELMGTVNPRGVTTEGWFEWSKEPSLDQASVTPAQPMGSGSTDLNLTASLAGLEPGGMYYFRAVATNARGTVRGSTLSFTTLRPPTVYTFPYDQTGNIANVVNGFVTPNGSATISWFDYGTDSTFTTLTQTTKQSVGAGEERVTVTETLPGLQAYTTYYLRVMASSAGGTTAGNIAWFRTGGPPQIVSTGFFPAAECDVVNLFAYASSNGAQTIGWFEYGVSSTMAEYTATPVRTLPLGVTRPAMFGASLPMGSTFYFRAVVSNWLGTERSAVYTISPDICGN